MELVELRASCLQGDDEAWAELYSRMFPLAKSIAAKPPFCFDSCTASDIAQDVMVELTRKLDEVGNVRAFTGRVSHNKCVDRVRKKKEIPLASFTREDDEASRLLEGIPAPEYLPDSLDDSRVFDCLRVALDQLGNPCSLLLRARFFDELSYDDVACKSSIPVAQVGVYISRCLARLRKAVQKNACVWDELEVLMLSTR